MNCIQQTYKLLNLNNLDQIEKIIKEENINIIYHAAAYKHVPMLESEENFNAAIENNFFVTFDLCKLAFENKVNKFTLVSTDKAVNPTNIMGASKRLAELSLQAFQDESNNKTKFSMVRFGNVLNSSGSVVPIFREQIANGGPVVVAFSLLPSSFLAHGLSYLYLQYNVGIPASNTATRSCSLTCARCSRIRSTCTSTALVRSSRCMPSSTVIAPAKRA